MDPLLLLTRSAKPFKRRAGALGPSLPSNGPRNTEREAQNLSNGNGRNLKRKRGTDEPLQQVDRTDDEVDFFKPTEDRKERQRATASSTSKRQLDGDTEDDQASSWVPMSIEEKKRLLRQHKLKVNSTVRSPVTSQEKTKRKKSKEKEEQEYKTVQLYPEPLLAFQHLRSRYGISSMLAHNILEQGFHTPTEVQMAALPLLLGDVDELQYSDQHPLTRANGDSPDLLTVAPTGSGKTLAFLIPLLQTLGTSARRPGSAPSAIILAPTKELVHQITSEGRKLAKGLRIRFEAFRKDTNQITMQAHLDSGKGPDVLVATPASLALALGAHDSPTGTENLPDVKYLVLDEADVLLDPLFRDQTTCVWKACTNADLRVSLWSATIASSVEDDIKKTIAAHQDARKATSRAPLVRLVVGLKDSAVPNVTHRLTYCATEAGKLLALRELLNPKSATTTTSNSTPSSGPALRAPFLVFTQTIARCTALHAELKYDIPVSAGGASRIAVLHSDLPDRTREGVLALFRKGEIWVLVTTDLLARGVDFRGVNGVVNYDVPTSAAGYVHRVGRTGRQGREGGVAVTLYTRDDIKYVKIVANVIAAAQKARGGRVGELVDDQGVQQWLLDALPDVSKEDRKKLKKRGVEERRQGKKESRISSKSGFVRREENRKLAFHRRGHGEAVGPRPTITKDRKTSADDAEFDGFSD